MSEGPAKPTDKLKELIDNLDTPDGRDKVANEVLREPIRRSLEFTGIARKCLLVDEEPEGSEPEVIAADDTVAVALIHNSIAHVIDYGKPALPRRNCLPTFLVRSVQKMPYKHVPPYKIRREIDRCNIAAVESIKRQENGAFLKLCDALRSGNNIQCHYVKALGRRDVVFGDFIDTFGNMVDTGIIPTKLLARSSDILRHLYPMGTNHFNEATLREILTANLMGHFLTADVHGVGDALDRGQMYLFGPPDQVGDFAIKSDISVRCAGDTNGIIRWEYSEEIGLAITNTNAVCSLTIA
jgi:hypothetical protein